MKRCWRARCTTRWTRSWSRDVSVRIRQAGADRRGRVDRRRRLDSRGRDHRFASRDRLRQRRDARCSRAGFRRRNPCRLVRELTDCESARHLGARLRNEVFHQRAADVAPRGPAAVLQLSAVAFLPSSVSSRDLSDAWQMHSWVWPSAILFVEWCCRCSGIRLGLVGHTVGSGGKRVISSPDRASRSPPLPAVGGSPGRAHRCRTGS